MTDVESQVEEGQPETETGTDEQIASEATESAPVQGDSGTTDDWWNTDGLDEKAAARVKAIQTEYNKKAEKIAELEGVAKSTDEIRRQYDQLQADIIETLKDPNKYDSYRKQYLGADGQTKQEAPPTLKEGATIAEFEEYLAKREQWRENKLRAEYDMKLAQEFRRVADPLMKDKWENALNKMRSSQPEFERYEHKVVQSILTGPFKNLYGNMDEVELLKTAFKAISFDDVVTTAKKSGKAEGLEALKKKKAASTEQPRKRAPTASTVGKSKEEIIERIRARLGE